VHVYIFDLKVQNHIANHLLNLA